MALRRLFSGWLIAMAALARSMALALERAAADRSEPVAKPASDPIMAALEARYPGAPAHWLAHLAERTAQLADLGEAPLFMGSDGISRTPFDVAPPVASIPLPEASHFPAPRSDTASDFPASRDRRSPTWSRPEAPPRRRPRPVFAPLIEPSASGPASRGSGASNDAKPPSDPAPEAPMSPDPMIADRAEPVVGPAEAPSPDFVSPKTVPIAPRARFVEDHGTASGQVSRQATEASEPPARRSLAATDPPPPVAKTRSTVSWPFSGRTAARRRPIFSALAGVSAKRRTDRLWDQLAELPQAIVEERAASAPSVEEPTRRPGARRPNSRTAAPIRMDQPTKDDWRVWLEDQDLDPPAPPERRKPEKAAPPESRSGDPRSRASFAGPSPISAKDDQSGRLSAVDDRWPSFPPGVFAAPPVAEIPPSRFDQLARDQEEGRWNV